MQILAQLNVQDVPLPKVAKMALRATAPVRPLLADKLAGRADCVQIRLALCDTEEARLQILFQNNLKDFS